MNNLAILYYTNNLVPPALLETTLRFVSPMVETDNVELIVTSHFPVTKEYVIKRLCDEDYYKPFRGNLYSYLVKDKPVDVHANTKAFVVGKLPYSLESIIKQILLSIDNCESDNVVFMEHDCFYPFNYLEAVDKTLKMGSDIVFVNKKRCFLNVNGFYDLKSTFLLSGFAGKKDVMKNIFEKKLEIINKKGGLTSIEPVIDLSETSHVIPHTDEIRIENVGCIDCYLKGSILDIRHQFNSSANVWVDKTRDVDPYWGDAKRYINMIEEVKVTDGDKYFWGWGTIELDY